MFYFKRIKPRFLAFSAIKTRAFAHLATPYEFTLFYMVFIVSVIRTQLASRHAILTME